MISREKFVAYLEVQKSGLTNMLDGPQVRMLAEETCDVELTEKEHIDIISNYGILKKKYLREWKEIFKEDPK